MNWIVKLICGLRRSNLQQGGIPSWSLCTCLPSTDPKAPPTPRSTREEAGTAHALYPGPPPGAPPRSSRRSGSRARGRGPRERALRAGSRLARGAQEPRVPGPGPVERAPSRGVQRRRRPGRRGAQAVSAAPSRVRSVRPSGQGRAPAGVTELGGVGRGPRVSVDLGGLGPRLRGPRPGSSGAGRAARSRRGSRRARGRA